jgi:hypothetical protein
LNVVIVVRKNLPTIKATREFCFKVWEYGIDAIDEKSRRTAERVMTARRGFDAKRSSFQLESSTGWIERTVSDVKGYYEEFRLIHPESMPKQEPKNYGSSDTGYSSIVYQDSKLTESMWVPEPDAVPIYSLEGGPGFRATEIAGRQFFWTQAMEERSVRHGRGRRVSTQILVVVRVWFTEAEEAQLQTAIGFLDSKHGTVFAERYEELQKATVEYFRRTIAYNCGVATQGWTAIARIQAAERGGEIVNSKHPAIAPSYSLMSEAPTLRGKVEEFKKDLQLYAVGRE